MFVQGLRYYYFNRIKVDENNTYQEALNQALRVEQRLKERRERERATGGRKWSRTTGSATISIGRPNFNWNSFTSRLNERVEPT